MVAKNLTSVIMTCYDRTQTMRHTSMLAVADITRYTNPKEYELIIVDAEPKFPFRDDYHVLKIDKMITLDEDPGYYECMNVGARQARGKYLCFIENDVFVPDDWLPKLRWYLESELTQAIMPNQIPSTRKYIQRAKGLSLFEAFGGGRTEAGLLMMTRKLYDKIGAWDKSWTGKPPYLGWRRMYEQVAEAGHGVNNTAAVTISHVTGMTEYYHLEGE